MKSVATYLYVIHRNFKLATLYSRKTFPLIFQFTVGLNQLTMFVTVQHIMVFSVLRVFAILAPHKVKKNFSPKGAKVRIYAFSYSSSHLFYFNYIENRIRPMPSFTSFYTGVYFLNCIVFVYSGALV